jgi:hypothetical protein
MPKSITQAELRAVLEHFNDANRCAAEIRQRILDGAQLETGALAASDNGEVAGSLPYDKGRHFCGYGLEISPAEILPSWLKDTTSGLDYILEAREFQHTEMVQDVRLTQSEYVAAKELVAKLRGYAVSEVAHA